MFSKSRFNGFSKKIDQSIKVLTQQQLVQGQTLNSVKQSSHQLNLKMNETRKMQVQISRSKLLQMKNVSLQQIIHQSLKRTHRICLCQLMKLQQ